MQSLVLYGSHARNEAREHSDIDVMVLLDDQVPQEDLHPLWNRLELLAHRVDSRIETWPVHSTRFETDEASPLIIVAREQGIPVAA